MESLLTLSFARCLVFLHIFPIFRIEIPKMQKYQKTIETQSPETAMCKRQSFGTVYVIHSIREKIGLLPYIYSNLNMKPKINIQYNMVSKQFGL